MLDTISFPEAAILLYSDGDKSNGGSGDEIVLDTSNCACSHQRWYCLKQSLYIAFSCGRELLKTEKNGYV